MDLFEFEPSQCYTVKPCLKQTKKITRLISGKGKKKKYIKADKTNSSTIWTMLMGDSQSIGKTADFWRPSGIPSSGFDWLP